MLEKLYRLCPTVYRQMCCVGVGAPTISEPVELVTPRWSRSVTWGSMKVCSPQSLLRRFKRLKTSSCTETFCCRKIGSAWLTDTLRRLVHGDAHSLRGRMR